MHTRSLCAHTRPLRTHALAQLTADSDSNLASQNRSPGRSRPAPAQRLQPEPCAAPAAAHSQPCAAAAQPRICADPEAGTWLVVTDYADFIPCHNLYADWPPALGKDYAPGAALLAGAPVAPRPSAPAGGPGVRPAPPPVRPKAQRAPPGPPVPARFPPLPPDSGNTRPPPRAAAAAAGSGSGQRQRQRAGNLRGLLAPSRPARWSALRVALLADRGAPFRCGSPFSTPTIAMLLMTVRSSARRYAGSACADGAGLFVHDFSGTLR